MILGDFYDDTVLISLLLKLFFIGAVFYDLLLPRLVKITLIESWKTEVRKEITSWAVEGGAFIGCIMILISFDWMIAEDSWIPFLLTFLLDIALIIAILVLLFFPKENGISENGVYLHGWVIPWSEVVHIRDKGDTVVIERKGFFKENKVCSLPEDKQRVKVIMKLITSGLAGNGLELNSDKLQEIKTSDGVDEGSSVKSEGLKSGEDTGKEHVGQVKEFQGEDTEKEPLRQGKAIQKEDS